MQTNKEQKVDTLEEIDNIKEGGDNESKTPTGKAG